MKPSDASQTIELQQLTASDSRLDDALGGLPEDLVPNALEAAIADRPHPPWPIDSEYDAMAWAFRVAQLRARAAWAKDMAKQIERQAEAEERRLVFLVGGRTFKEAELERTSYGQVEEWARAHLPKGKKSLKTPAGTFAFRAAPSLAKVRDGAEKALLAWCKEHAPDWVKTVETIDHAALKAHIEATGEVPADQSGEPLVEFFASDRRDLFSFKPAEGAATMPLGAAPRPRQIQETAI